MRCPPSFWLVVKLRPARAADRWRSLLLVHSRTASGSTADRRLHQRVEGFQKSRLCLDRRLAAAAHSTHPITQLHGACSQISKGTTDRTAGDPGHARYRCHPTATRCAGFTGGKQAPFSFVQEWRKRVEAGRNRN